MSRRPAASTHEPDPSLAYVRDADTPVVLRDVVEALERVTVLAETRRDGELARAARHARALAAALRAQFVTELVGATPPSETAIALDRERGPARRDREPGGGGASRLQAAR